MTPKTRSLLLVPALALGVGVAAPLVAPSTTLPHGHAEEKKEKKEKKKKEPSKAALAGKELYTAQCVVCHGESGKGDGPAGASLDPKPRDFTDKKVMSTLSNDYIKELLAKGGAALGKSPAMPPFPQLKEEDVKNVTAYLRHMCDCDYKAPKKKKEK